MLGASGLLSHADRDLLVQGGVEMPGSYEKPHAAGTDVLFTAL